MDGLFFQHAASALGTAVTVGQALAQFKSSTEFQLKLSEMQSAFIAAQASALVAQASESDLIEQVRTLKEECVRLKDWSAEKQRYQLINTWRGAVTTYAVKKSHCNSEPPHLLCANCYNQGEKSILQQSHVPVNSKQKVALICHRCQAVVGSPDYFTIRFRYAEDYLPKDDSSAAE